MAQKLYKNEEFICSQNAVKSFRSSSDSADLCFHIDFLSFADFGY